MPRPAIFSGIAFALHPFSMKIAAPALSCLLVGLPLFSAAQQLSGHVNVPAASGQVVSISRAQGEAFVPVDSIHIDANGDFAFPQHFNNTGFYRLTFKEGDHLDIILNPKEPRVELTFDSIPLSEHYQVSASDENQRLREFNFVAKETQAVRAASTAKRRMLMPVDTAAINALNRIEQRAVDMQAEYLDQLADHAPESYFAKILRVDKALADIRGKGARAVAEACDFSDPSILHAQVYDRAIMAYLQNLNISAEQQFAAATDSLVTLASRNPECRAYMVEHLLDLFAAYGPQVAVDHIIARYASPGSDSFVPTPALQAKVDAMLQLAIGHFAPNIRLGADEGAPWLADLVRANKYTAVFFYSSTCSHCQAQMPVLKADRLKYKANGFDVIGMALDTDSAEFRAAIHDYAIPWKCFSEFNGWGASAAKEFMVKATPTLFLLNSRMEIVAKPTDAEELGKVLAGLYK